MTSPQWSGPSFLPVPPHPQTSSVAAQEPPSLALEDQCALLSLLRPLQEGQGRADWVRSGIQERGRTRSGDLGGLLYCSPSGAVLSVSGAQKRPVRLPLEQSSSFSCRNCFWAEPGTAVFSFRSQENVVFSVHDPELRLQAAAGLSRAPNPPTEHMRTGWTGGQQPASVASART